MGLFDLLLEPLTWFSEVVRSLGGSDGLTVSLLGIISGVVSMLMYRRISPQQNLTQVGEDIHRVRAALVAYDGDMDGMLKLVRTAAGLSLKQLWLTGWPAVVSSLPVLFIAVPLSALFDFETPKSGDVVEMRVLPASASQRVSTTNDLALARDAAGVLRFRWPENTTAVKLSLDDSGSISVSAQSICGGIDRFRLHNLLVGSANPSIAASSAVDHIEVSCPQRDLVGFGPEWLRAWWVTFFVTIVATSFFLRWRWGIH